MRQIKYKSVILTVNKLDSQMDGRTREIGFSIHKIRLFVEYTHTHKIGDIVKDNMIRSLNIH